MKIRTSFVANSSSSSFIIACKDLHNESQHILYRNFLKEMFRDAKIISSLKEYEKYLLDNYGCSNDTLKDVFKDEPYLKETYEKVEMAFSKNFQVYKFRLENSEDFLINLLQSLPNEDDGDGIFLIEGY